MAKNDQNEHYPHTSAPCRAGVRCTFGPKSVTVGGSWGLGFWIPDIWRRFLDRWRETTSSGPKNGQKLELGQQSALAVDFQTGVLARPWLKKSASGRDETVKWKLTVSKHCEAVFAWPKIGQIWPIFGQFSKNGGFWKFGQKVAYFGPFKLLFQKLRFWKMRTHFLQGSGVMGPFFRILRISQICVFLQFCKIGHFLGQGHCFGQDPGSGVV